MSSTETSSSNPLASPPVTIEMEPVPVRSDDMALCVVRFFGRRALQTLYGRGATCGEWHVHRDPATGRPVLRRDAHFCVGRVLGFPIRAASEQTLALGREETWFGGARRLPSVRVASVARVSGAPFCARLALRSDFTFTPLPWSSDAPLRVSGCVSMHNADSLGLGLGAAVGRVFRARTARRLQEQREMMLGRSALEDDSDVMEDEAEARDRAVVNALIASQGPNPRMSPVSSAFTSSLL